MKKQLQREIFLKLKNIAETNPIAADLAKDITKIVMKHLNPIEKHKHDMFHIWTDKNIENIHIKNLRNNSVEDFDKMEMLYFFFSSMMVEELKYISEHGKKKGNK